LFISTGEVVPIKILSLNYSDITAPGGVHAIIRNVSEELVKRGHRAIVFSINSGQSDPFETINGVELIRIKSPLSKYAYGLSYATYKFLGKNLAKIEPDIIHVHGYHTLFSAEAVYLIKRIAPDVPLVFSYYLDVYREQFLAKRLWNAYKPIGKRMARALARVIAVSHFEAETITREFQVPSGHISVIPLGVRVIDTHKTRAPGAGPRLLYAGYLLKRKNVPAIVESLDVLVHQQNVQGASLTIVGEGPEHARINRLIHKRGLEAHVTMKPFLALADLMREMKHADLFLLLSHSEAYGIVVAEALALGTPCIVADATALHEFIGEPGCFGVDCPPDPEKVARLIMAVYEGNAQVGPFSDKIRTWDVVGRTYERLYYRCTKQAP
jgi:glycosyltransferase involved in cell wall biosynthesis